MAHDEQYWSERAKSAEAQLGTLKQQIEPMQERYRNFKANMGVKERSDGSLVIDYDKFVERLGPEASAELRKVIDEKFGVGVPPDPETFEHNGLAVHTKTLQVMPLQPGDTVKGPDGMVGEFIAYGTDGKPRFKVRPVQAANADEAPRQKRKYTKRKAA